MATVKETLARGWEYQRAGQFPTAEKVYQGIADAHPDNAEALYLLGTVCHRQGKLDDAAQNLLMAVSLKPDYAEAHNNLGVVMAMMGRRIEATNHFRHVVRLRPRDADAANNLGNALREQRELKEAGEWLRHALVLRPDFPDALHNLGLIMHDLGRPDDAVARLSEAARLRPDFADAHGDLGLVLAKLKRWDEAAEHFLHLIRLRPDRADGFMHLGATLRELGQLDESADRLRHAVRLNANDANLRSSLGLTLQQLGQLPEAEEHLRKAIELDPNHADARNNLGITLAQTNRYAEALEQYGRAIDLKPDSSVFRRNRALAWLATGDFAQGWPEFEYRWKCPGFTERNYPAPRWNGEPLEGKTVLLYWEQGLGDTLQMVRYAAQVKQLGATVMVEVQPSLPRLLSKVAGIDRVVTAGSSVPAFDYHIPLGSLPWIFQTTVDTIPANVPYLAAEPERVTFWRSQLSAFDGFKVGIAWQGNSKQGGDRLRSIPLTHFAPLTRIGNVRLFSLQKESGSEQLRKFADTMPVVDLAPRLDLSGGAFLDTAAVMKNLDLVVTCDTSIGHLAGGLGVPVWVALSAAADWRWMERRDDTPWYPTMRLFRQTRLGHWQDVFERIAAELTRRAGRGISHGSIPIEISPGELIDKVTILQIKNERITDPTKRRHVRAELDALTEACNGSLPPSEEVSALAQELKDMNEVIWHVEDELRRCEREQQFDSEFIELARKVYRTNDRRAALKRRINEFYSAKFIEEKEHPTY